MTSFRSLVREIWDFIGLPFRLVLFDQSWLPRFGWSTLEDDRVRVVLPRIHGRLLDIGAGPNRLVNEHGDGIGVDVHDWGGGVVVVEDTSDLPYEDDSFDTVSFIACLNHIPYREEVLREAARLLKDDGRIIITMINPILGDLGHAVWWYSEDKHRGGMVEGEVGGMWTSSIVTLLEGGGFRLSEHRRFEYGMNHLYVFTR